jgi:hypothetical protein
MPDPATLGLVGGVLSALGVALALVGTTKVRAAIGQFWNWLVPKPVNVYGASASITLEVTAKGRGRVGPGPEGWSDERWHTELEKRIDQLAAEVDRHDHPDISKRIDRLGEADTQTRADFEAELVHLATDAGTSERWNIWGLAFALIGVVVQTAAVVAS